MTQDFNRRDPFPRRPGRAFAGNSPNRPRRPGRPGPPRRPAPPKPPKGPSVIAPKVPASNKERKRMLKAAARSLAMLVGARPAAVLAATPQMLQEMVLPLNIGPRRGSKFGEARRLANKVLRLR